MRTSRFTANGAPLPAKVRALTGDAPAALHGALQQPYDFAAGLLMFTTMWTRRALLVWALVPPLAIGIVEKIAFNTSHFAAALGSVAAGAGSTEMMGLWTGLVLTGGFLAAAVRLRRSQVPV